MDSFSHAKPDHDSRNLSTEHNLLEFKNGMILPLLMVHNVLIANQSNTKFLWSKKPLSNSLIVSWCHCYAKLFKRQSKEPLPLSSGNPYAMYAITMTILPCLFHHDRGLQCITLMQREAFWITFSTILLGTGNIYIHKDFNQQQTWFVQMNSSSHSSYLEENLQYTLQIDQCAIT
jgi:hypothetical protein